MSLDPDDALEDAIAQIRRAQAALARQQVRRVTFDLDGEDDDVYFVLTGALSEWAAREEHDAEDGDPLSAADRLRWAGCARKLLAMTEAALDRTIEEGGAEEA